MTKSSLTAGESSGNNNSCNKCQLETKESKSGGFRMLSFLTAQRAIHKFLTCDWVIRVEKRCLKYSKEELAKKLGITLKEFEKLRSPSCYKNIAAKITQPLASLCCSTKWIDSEYEDGSDE